MVIVGSGLGGLQCGYILSKEGYNVCVIEKNKQIGGCLQTFKRDGCIFDTGIHYLGGLDDGQSFYRYLKYFGLIDKLKLKRLDSDAFDVISFDGDDASYKFPMGLNNYIESLAANFPSERGALNKYRDKIREICASFPLYNLEASASLDFDSPYFGRNTKEYISSLTNDEKLRNLLIGMIPLYAGVPDKTPLYLHALVINSYIESSYRLVDGSSQIAEILSSSIIENGGTIIKANGVKEFLVDDDNVTSVELENDERIEGKYFISNIHPMKTLQMLKSDKIKKIFRKRIDSLENTIGAFTIYVVFKKDTFKYLNSNYYHFRVKDLWDTAIYNDSDWPSYYLFMTPATSNSDRYADCAIIIAFMKYDEVKKWENTTVEKRGDDYLQFKRRSAERLLDEAEKRYPGMRSNIKTYYTSTPLTYRDYTGTINGSMYGILKDCQAPMKTYISARTKLPNLFFTGQNVDMHGCFGVTIGSVLTCSELLGVEYLMDKIKKS